MGQPAARVGDMHVCPMFDGPKPHVGGPILPVGVPTVLIGGMPAATVGTLCACASAPDVIIKGSPTVLIGGRPAARLGDLTAHGGSIIVGCPTVLIGDFGMGALSGLISTDSLNAPAPDSKVSGASTASASVGASSPSGTTTVSSGLGKDVDALIEKSQTLTKQLKTLKDKGWEIRYGAKGKGSYASRRDKIITIDENSKGQTALLVRTVSHEAGHAMYPYQEDTSSREAYVKGTLADEGAATMNNIQVQREIYYNSNKVNIGIAGNPKNHAGYNGAFNQYQKDGDAAKARNSIGSIFGQGEQTSDTHEKYEDYYGGSYDKKYGKNKP